MINDAHTWLLEIQLELEQLISQMKLDHSRQESEIKDGGKKNEKLSKELQDSNQVGLPRC